MRALKRRDFLKTLGAGAFSLGLGSHSFCRKVPLIKPNIIYINLDDLGWKDLGFMGSQFYETPRIDKLASGGVVFTNAYAPAANCAPSRASCLTGQYTPRHGIYTVNKSDRGDARTRKLIPIKNKADLASEKMTIAENLKASAYASAHIGKWHLGDDPKEQGFDINIGGGRLGHPKSYFSPYQNKDLKDGPEGEYLTDRLTDEAIKFVENHQKSPFFLHLAYYAVHSPIQPKKEKVEKYARKRGSQGQSNARYAAMIEGVDENIGRFMAKLDELGLTEDTVIVFMSDNGGVSRRTSMAPLRAGKGSYYEGGIRVPLIVRWPAKVRSGIRCDTPVSGIDLYPTFLEMTGTPRAKQKILDGVSLMPLLTRSGGLKKRALFWHFPVYLEGGNVETRDPVFRTRPGSVIRFGDWKLHEYFEDKGIELYNLNEDIGEKFNLAEKFPEKTTELQQMLTSWRRKIVAPVPSEQNPGYDQKYDSSLRRSLYSKRKRSKKEV